MPGGGRVGYVWPVTRRGTQLGDAPATSRHRHTLLLALSVVVVAVNLRPAVAGVGPVLPDLRAGLPLSGSGAAVLTTLPVLCFGLLATAAPRLARRYGMEPVLTGAMVLLVLGLLGRVLDGPPALFTGTVLAGGAIAVGNVLLPPLIKRDFPERSGLMMGVYTMSVSGAAAVAAGLAVPIASAGLGWRGALGVWAVPAAVAAAAWLPRLRGHTRPPASPAPGSSLLRDPLAWQLTAFFGLQSLSFYAMLGWLPSMYRDFGASPAQAGFLLSLCGLVQIPVSLVVPGLAGRARNQIGYAVAGTVLIGAGTAGILLAPMAAPYLWVVLAGAGQGTCFALGLNLLVLRTRRLTDTARVSAMAQSLGYTICAFGPLLVGVLHEVTTSWTAPLVLLLALVVPQLVCGALAGRDRTLRE
jgi:MFS transporter, CP family, cyanate transporter